MLYFKLFISQMPVSSSDHMIYRKHYGQIMKNKVAATDQDGWSKRKLWRLVEFVVIVPDRTDTNTPGLSVY